MNHEDEEIEIRQVTSRLRIIHLESTKCAVIPRYGSIINDVQMSQVKLIFETHLNIFLISKNQTEYLLRFFLLLFYDQAVHTLNPNDTKSSKKMFDLKY